MGSILLNNREINPGNLGILSPDHFIGIEAGVLSEIKEFLKEWWGESKHIVVDTSGSTGTPKEISLSKDSITASANKTISFFDLKPDQNAMLCLPVRYIAGKLMVIRALRAKMNLVVVNPTLRPLEELQSQIDFAAMIPPQVFSALNQDITKKKLQKISRVLIGGAPIDYELEKQLAKLPNRFYHSYGMTETATHVALREIGKSQEYAALEGIQFFQDEHGCLVIEADHLEEKVVTNDLVELLDNTRFTWLGRADHAIISGGLKHIPEVLEKKIAAVIKVPFYIIGKSDTDLGQKLVLVIEGKPSKELEFQYLKEKMSAVLQRHEVPKELVLREQFSRTETGKIIRN